MYIIDNIIVSIFICTAFDLLVFSWITFSLLNFPRWYELKIMNVLLYINILLSEVFT